MRTCSKCGQSGHYTSTCGKPKAGPYIPKGTRKCGKCGERGHNAATCGTPRTTPEVKPEVQQLIETIAELQNADITKPHAGFYLIQPDKRKCIGMIIQVLRDEIIWKDFSGIVTTSVLSNIQHSGYKYSIQKPKEPGWLFMHCGGWDENPAVTPIVSHQIQGE